MQGLSTFISEDGECAEVGLEGGWLRLLACCWLMPCISAKVRMRIKQEKINQEDP